MDLSYIVEQQLECLSYAIYHEARSESLKGQLMVGFVVRNRVEHDAFSDGFCAVIKEPWQFSFYDQIGFARMDEDDAAIKAEEVAWMVASSRSPFPECMLYYHADHVKPNWDYEKIEVYDIVGSHIFYVDLECKDGNR